MNILTLMHFKKIAISPSEIYLMKTDVYAEVRHLVNNHRRCNANSNPNYSVICIKERVRKTRPPPMEEEPFCGRGFETRLTQKIEKLFHPLLWIWRVLGDSYIVLSNLKLFNIIVPYVLWIFKHDI